MAKRRTVVIVEDDAPIRRGIVDMLTLSGYDVIEAADGAAGLTCARQAGVDLVLLDLMLPALDGLDVLAALRQTHPALPVIILTARGSEEDRVRGLKQGADDYVIKPFSVRELLARVEAVLRRSPERPLPVVRIQRGDTVVDCGRREVIAPDGTCVALSEMEASVLLRLAAHRDRAVSREELLSAIWGIRDGQVETRAIDMHITRLRNKLSASSGGDASDWITTVRGKGYMLGTGLSVSTNEEP